MARNPDDIIGPATEFECRLDGKSRVAWFDHTTIDRIERWSAQHYGQRLSIFQLTSIPSVGALAAFLAYGLDHEGVGGMGNAQANRKPTPARMLQVLTREKGRFLELWKGCVVAITANFPEADELTNKRDPQAKNEAPADEDDEQGEAPAASARRTDADG